MFVKLCKSKIHRARITECILDYEGSLGIDLDLMDMVGLYPYEKVLVSNATNGQRLETYAIPMPRGQRNFTLNGAAARLGAQGDIIIIMAFGSFEPKEAEGFLPKIVVLDENNQIIEKKGALKKS